MLSDKEKEFLKEILILMSQNDLKLLAHTVTDNMIVPLTTEGKVMSEDIVTCRGLGVMKILLDLLALWLCSLSLNYN
jgi:hypothetical protein